MATDICKEGGTGFSFSLRDLGLLPDPAAANGCKQAEQLCPRSHPPQDGEGRGASCGPLPLATPINSLVLVATFQGQFPGAVLFFSAPRSHAALVQYLAEK